MPDLGGMVGDALGLGVTYKTPNGVIGGIWIDCTVRERHNMSAEISNHPIEEGSDVTDHIRAQPRSVTLECIISNKPVSLPESHASGAQAVSTKIEVPPAPAKLPFGLGDAAVRVGPLGELAIKEPREATVTSFEPPFNRVDDIWKELDLMQVEGRLVSVHTSLVDYQSMAIEEVDAPRDVTTFASLRFTITLKQITTVSSELGSVTDIPRASPKRSKGKQSAVDATGAPAADRASALHGILEGAGVF